MINRAILQTGRRQTLSVRKVSFAIFTFLYSGPFYIFPFCIRIGGYKQYWQAYVMFRKAYAHNPVY